MPTLPLPKGLPIPSQQARQHSAKVTQTIQTAIADAGGQIPFARFMQLALYAPGLGYYMAGAPTVGYDRDFMTAPELSPLFSQCLARQVEQILSESKDSTILELGAGSGIMAAQLLLALAQTNALPKQYAILEPSPSLQARQRQTLQTHCPDLLRYVTWLNTLPDNPFSGTILANEVIDAMPVHLLQYRHDTLMEYYVRYDGEKFRWAVDKLSDHRLLTHWQQFGLRLAEGYTSEVNLLVNPWLNSLNDCLAQGAILLIDYGFPRHEYYHPERAQGTLMCHYQQRAHTDPLILPGLQDITAHVDFTSLALHATTLRLTVAGFTNQASFLLNCGLLEYMQASKDAKDKQARFTLNQQVQLLTSPNEMGELFKVMALVRNVSMPLLGFTRYDQRHRLLNGETDYVKTHHH